MTKILPHNGNENYYDLFDDWNLIEASFLKQYGIRIRQDDDDMSWDEFCSLLSGLMHDTPLGRIVAIRAETDPKIIKEFSTDERRIRNEWLMRRNKKLKENKKAYAEYWENFRIWAKANFKNK